MLFWKWMAPANATNISIQQSFISVIFAVVSTLHFCSGNGRTLWFYNTRLVLVGWLSQILWRELFTNKLSLEPVYNHCVCGLMLVYLLFFCRLQPNTINATLNQLFFIYLAKFSLEGYSRLDFWMTSYIQYVHFPDG